MTYIAEGHYMLEEGVPAALIENAGRMAGMPVGPLALNDEVALDLSWKIIQATRKDLADAYQEGPIDRILEDMVVQRGRHGRKNAKGFYDYPQERQEAPVARHFRDRAPARQRLRCGEPEAAADPDPGARDGALL
jgi:3-hydroxyacyl-CoA dehydrogenase